MKLNRLSSGMALAVALSCALPAVTSCGSQTARTESSTQHTPDTEGRRPGGPRLGTPGGGPVIDKSGDTTLQAMIKELVPQFRQYEYTDSTTGKSMAYNLFSPKDADGTKRYPIVLFMADASTPGIDVTRPLTQGYGALVWATRQWQAKHPCHVLVPQFSGVAVDDAYRHTDEADMVVRMLVEVADSLNADMSRLYTTGQSMGGMLSMYYNVAYPDLFAASIFVDSHWDTSTFPRLARHRFVYFIAGDKGKAYADLAPLEQAAKDDGVRYSFAEWSARLAGSRQDSLATDMLAKGAPVNIIQFTPGTVLPADGKGSEHMYSFDYAYRIAAVREWLFRQSRQ